NIPTININPVTTAVNPERPPTAIPAEDSTYAPTGEVPKIEPANMAVESEIKALPTSGILLFFIKPPCCAKPTNVPAVSKNVTNKNVSTTTTSCKELISITCLKATPKVGAKLGIPETIS